MASKSKSKSKSKNVWLVVSVVAVSIFLYFVSSYSGLLGAKTFRGNSNKIATSLECIVSPHNKVQARLTVNDTVVKEEALPDGSALASQAIAFAVVDRSGVVSPSSGTTDESGLAVGMFEGGSAAPAITASFAGDVTRVAIDGTEEIVVEYSASSAQCE